MLRRVPALIIFVCVLCCAHSIAKEKTTEKSEKDELTLEKLFPEKSFFGPSAKSTAFSYNGQYAAYLYRPYVERRHGSDLWIYDVAKGKLGAHGSLSLHPQSAAGLRQAARPRPG